MMDTAAPRSKYPNRSFYAANTLYYTADSILKHMLPGDRLYVVGHNYGEDMTTSDAGYVATSTGLVACDYGINKPVNGT